MKYPLEHLIDRCITQLNSGMDLEDVLDQVPDQADELRPILAAVAWVRMEIPAPGLARRLEGKQAVMAAAAQRRRETEATQGLINELRAGVAVQDILARARPEQRALVLAAWRMHSTPPPTPNGARVALGKERLLALVEGRRRLRERALAARLSPGKHLKVGLQGFWQGLVAPRPQARRAISGAMSMAAFIAALGLGAGRVSGAAADSLPGDPIYSIKRLGESARIFFAFDADRRAELSDRFADARLREMLALSDEGRDIPAAVLRDWVHEQANAYGSIRRLPVAQQERLLNGLLQAFGSAEALEQALGESVDHRLSGMLSWMQAAAAPLLDKAAPSPADGSAALPHVPLPIERPVALDEETEAAPALKAAVPTAPVSSETAEAAAAPAPDFVMPDLVLVDEDEDEQARPAGQGASTSSDQPTVEPTDDTQIVQPPVELPTPGDDPQEDPGTGGSQEPEPQP